MDRLAIGLLATVLVTGLLVLLSGGEDRKASSGEAGVMLAQDWAKAFPAEAPSPTTTYDPAGPPRSRG